MDISEGVSDGQHFPSLYFFCKVYICPLFSLKSSRTIISTDSWHFCSQKIAQHVSKQTNQYFSVSDGQKKSFPSDTYSVQCIRQTAHFCAWSVLHAGALRKRKDLQDFTKKIERNKTSKFSLEFDTIWTLQIIFFKMKILKILCRNSTISHLIIKVDPKYWSYMPVSTPKNEFWIFPYFPQIKIIAHPGITLIADW